MEKRSLDKVFLSIFHDKFSFNDFVSFELSSNYKKLMVNNREVFSASKELKDIHKFINSSILAYAKYNKDVVYSYTKGVSIRDAIEKHSGSKFFLQTDISNFYGSLNRDNIEVSLRHQIDNFPISDIGDYIDLIVNLTVVEDKLPAGFSTSPLLSNLCLLDFDTALLKYASENELVYTRYSDDLIISSVDDRLDNNIVLKIESLLCKHVNDSISLNHSKTKFNHIGNSFKLLGLNILPNGTVTIPSLEKKKLETLIYLYFTDKDKFIDFIKKNVRYNKESKERTVVEVGTRYITNKLVAFNSMDPEYVNKLRRKYGNAVIEMFVRQSVN